MHGRVSIMCVCACVCVCVCFALALFAWGGGGLGLLWFGLVCCRRPCCVVLSCPLRGRRRLFCAVGWWFLLLFFSLLCLPAAASPSLASFPPFLSLFLVLSSDAASIGSSVLMGLTCSLALVVLALLFQLSFLKIALEGLRFRLLRSGTSHVHF